MNITLDKIKNKPTWMDKIDYLTQMGSRAYGTNDENSDYDFYGFVVPPAKYLFPHMTGELMGFDRQKERFEGVYLQHEFDEKFEYDLTIFNIVKYFRLVADGNPNMIESLFTDDISMILKTNVGNMVKINRRMFLSKKCFYTFMGMANNSFSSLLSGRIPVGRKESFDSFGYDVKSFSNTMRVLLELKDILDDGDFSLKRHSDYVKKCKSGYFPKGEAISLLEGTIKKLENHFRDSKILLPDFPDEQKIKNLLESCIEETHGNLSKFGYGIER